MKHPGETELALLAGDELGWLARGRLQRHTRACPACRLLVETYREDRLALRALSSELPPGTEWTQLSAEMRANIHLGLIAGECVSRTDAPAARSAWRPALALASVTLVVVAGWWLNLPQPLLPPPARAEGVVLEATSSGVELKQNDRALALLAPASRNVTFSANTQGVLRASYVDADTGSVTINNVYAQ